MTYYLVAGLGFGDEGKGSVVDALTRHTDAKWNFRYNGGAQCKHNVCTSDGRHHDFSQFGSGSFVPDVKTYLSRFVLVNPVSMLIEAEILKRSNVEVLHRTFVDAKAPIITPFHRALNRLLEMSRNNSRHGSTGMGIGTTRADHIEYGDAMLLAGDLATESVTKDKLRFVQALTQERVKAINSKNVRDLADYTREYNSVFSDTIIDWYWEQYKVWTEKVAIAIAPPATSDNIIFEGGQGMLLDETYGFNPHTTWTDITYNNANILLQEMGNTQGTYKIGVLRSYFTRHGDGPFPSEDEKLQSDPLFQERHNTGVQYTGQFRVGYFDFSLVLYALECIGGVDSIAMNHLDILDEYNIARVRIGKDLIDMIPEDFIQTVEDMTKTPISILGFGPTAENKTFSKSIWEPGAANA